MWNSRWSSVAAMRHDEIDVNWGAGFPPPVNERVRFADGSFYQWPQLKWSFNNIEEVVPTRSVWSGPGAAIDMPTESVNLDELRIESAEGKLVPFADMLALADTDAFAVLHRGKLVYESYFGFAGAHRRHLLMSCNKSMVGVISECLIASGIMDDAAMVPSYVPELTRSAWADATVRQLLDMSIGMDYHEDYLDATSDTWRFIRSTGMIPTAPGEVEGVCEFLPTIGKAGEHGTAFSYLEPNIFVLGWLIRRAARRSIAELASDYVWQHIGAEHDWLYMLEDSGAETTAAATLRDFVRFGQLIADRGVRNGKRVLPEPVANAILGGGDRAQFAKGSHAYMGDWSYRSQWWYRHVDGRVCPVARGAHGQLLYIDPERDIVIARFASAEKAPSVLLDPITWPVVDAITAALSG
jgi:CubicO group peptidase (beta-lactamase class C family)